MWHSVLDPFYYLFVSTLFKIFVTRLFLTSSALLLISGVKSLASLFDLHWDEGFRLFVYASGMAVLDLWLVSIDTILEFALLFPANRKTLDLHLTVFQLKEMRHLVIGQ